MSVELSEQLFAKAAGWEAMKNARSYVQNDQVLSSDWAAPILKGVVQAGETSFRAGLIIKDPIDIENICTCRQSREWGTICAHSVAVGIHYLKASQAPVLEPSTKTPPPPSSCSTCRTRPTSPTCRPLSRPTARIRPRRDVRGLVELAGECIVATAAGKSVTRPVGKQEPIRSLETRSMA